METQNLLEYSTLQGELLCAIVIYRDTKSFRSETGFPPRYVAKLNFRLIVTS